jgi:membrane fusion protein (multidrug efflux system)
MRKYALPVLGTIAGLTALYVVAMWLAVWRFEVSTDDAYVQADIAAIAPKLAGYVEKIAVEDNQRVKAGDILLTLNTSDIKPKVEQAAALVEARKAAVENTDAKLKLQRSVIHQADASLASAKADAERTRKDIARYRRLAAQGYVSKQRLEIARADTAKADAATERARAALEAERAQVPVIESSRAQAAADLKQAEAQLALAQADLDNATLRAPFDGIIGNRTVQTGQYVRAGVQAMVVVPLPAVYVVANFKETQIGGMSVGQPARISVDALPDVDLTGRIESFAPASGALFSLLPPENATGNFTKIVQRIPVRIRVEGEPEVIARLRAGMSVGVTVDVRDAPKPNEPLQVAK